jgi:hypothetical protein
MDEIGTKGVFYCRIVINTFEAYNIGENRTFSNWLGEERFIDE